MILPFPKESPNASTGTTSRGAQGHPMPQVVVRLLLGHGNGTAWDAFFSLSRISAIRRKQRGNRGRKGAQNMTPSKGFGSPLRAGKI